MKLLILTTLHKMSASSLWESQEQHLYSITETQNEVEDLEESLSTAPDIQGIQGQVTNDEGVANLLKDLKTRGGFGILQENGFYMNFFGLQVEETDEKTNDENDDDVEGGNGDIELQENLQHDLRKICVELQPLPIVHVQPETVNDHV